MKKMASLFTLLLFLWTSFLTPVSYAQATEMWNSDISANEEFQNNVSNDITETNNSVDENLESANEAQEDFSVLWTESLNLEAIDNNIELMDNENIETKKQATNAPSLYNTCARHFMLVFSHSQRGQNLPHIISRQNHHRDIGRHTRTVVQGEQEWTWHHRRIGHRTTHHTWWKQYSQNKIGEDLHPPRNNKSR